MKLDSFLVEKMIIEKDFDQLKKILEDPEKANKLIAKKNDNFTIKKITNDSVIGKYTRSASGPEKMYFKILFLKKENKIEFIFETNVIFDTKVILVLTFCFFVFAIFDPGAFDFFNSILFAIGMFLLLSFIAYLIRLSVRKGIYNRIHNRWKDIVN